MAEYKSNYTGQEIDNAIKKQRQIYKIYLILMKMEL